MRVCLLSVGVQVDLLVGGKPAVGLNKGGRLHFQPYLRKKGDEVHHENLESKDRHKVRGGGVEHVELITGSTRHPLVHTWRRREGCACGRVVSTRMT